MKQLLSGKDWMVSHFWPDEVSSARGLIQRIAAGDPYGGDFIPATVPGDVQSDALDAGIIDEIITGFNARKAEWTYQRDWVYIKRFTPETVSCRRIRLCFDGVDYACQVYLNGRWLGNHEIAWIPFEFDITDKLLPGQENSLIVLVKAAPDAQCQFGYTSKVRHLKARFAYGWDWCTRLVPLGIWKDVYLKYDQEAAVEDLYAWADVDWQTKSAVVHAEITLSGEAAGKSLAVTLRHPCGKAETVCIKSGGEKVCADFCVDDAALWYPNGMGAQPLYEVQVILENGWDERHVNIGLRHVEWTRTDGAGDDALPYQPWINGRRVYLQGYNYTPARQLYGRVQADVYEKRLELVRRAGGNYLRIWGGGLLEREEFYDLCDRKGILVMQELFQSSAAINNHPPRDVGYIDMMVQATRSAVIQKRSHPSLVCWCGGNELCVRGGYIDTEGKILVEGAEGMEGLTFDQGSAWWIPLSPKYPTLAAMGETVGELDPQRLWLHTSGSGPVIQNVSLAHLGGAMHDVHGPWRILGPSEHYDLYNKLDMMIHHEFGCTGAGSVQTVESITPGKYLWPMDEYNPLLNFRGRMYNNALDKTEVFFGKLQNHREYILTTRFLQWEQLRYALEAHHRMDKRCAGACLWHLGEPWPNVIDNSLIDAFDQVKPAYYGNKAAFGSLHLSAHYDSVIHQEPFKVEYALHNTTTSDFAGHMKAELFTLDGACVACFEAAISAAADSVSSTAAAHTFVNLPDGLFFLRLTLRDACGRILEQGYSIHSTKERPYEPLLRQPVCPISAVLGDGILKIKNEGMVIVSALTVECGNDDSVLFSDGCLMLLPGEEAEIGVEFAGGVQVPLYISGFGVPYQELKL